MLYIWVNHLRHQKYKNKRLRKKSKLINIFINYIDKFKAERTTKEYNIYKKTLRMIGTTG